MPKIDTLTLINAWQQWRRITNSSVQNLHSFKRLLGHSDTNYFFTDNYDFTEEACNLVEALQSPHAYTLYRAYCIRHSLPNYLPWK